MGLARNGLAFLDMLFLAGLEAENISDRNNHGTAIAAL